jgi:hypothetical protein
MRKSPTYLFLIYFKVLSVTDYTAMNSWMSMKQQIRKDVKEVIQPNSAYYYGICLETEENQEKPQHESLPIS